jgi:hypothetical protein
LKNKKYLDWWVDRDIVPGAEWEKEILEALAAADVILLPVSTHFLASDFCWGVELAAAMDRHEAWKARVVPVFLPIAEPSAAGAPRGINFELQHRLGD